MTAMIAVAYVLTKDDESPPVQNANEAADRGRFQWTPMNDTEIFSVLMLANWPMTGDRFDKKKCKLYFK